MSRTGSLVAVCFVLLFGQSCAGSSGGPVSPDLSPPPDLASGREMQSGGSGTHLWGLWEIHIDPVNETVEAVPLRAPSYAANINRFVDGPPSNLLLRNMVVDDQPGYTDISLEVGLRHPFPGQNTFTGFDVLGVFMGQGSKVYPGTVPLPVAGDNDQRLLNADGYTRWFNRPEFKEAGQQLHLFGYDPGRAGTKGFYPSACLNAYKYFTDGLGVSDDAFNYLVGNPADRGCFRPGQSNYRQYDLRFPDAAGIVFQYAVVAHWEEHAKYPGQPSGLDDFPISANADEAVVLSVVDSSNLFYSQGKFGGQVVLDISPWDWSAECNVSGVMEEYEVKCFSSGWAGAYALDMTPVGGGDHYSTYHAEIPVTTLSSANPLGVWIEVNYPELDYTNPFGIQNKAVGALAGCFLHSVPVVNELPIWIKVLKPNGGESWTPGSTEEITWDYKDVPGTVFIEYSKDNFVSDIQSIATDEPCDGSYMWTIPDDPCPTVRVRISSTDDPNVWDKSDSNFTIYGPWITVTVPNGGEKWDPGTSKNITWTWNAIPGTIFIDYSKDNFVSDVNSIVVDEPCDGSYTWPSIPYDPSTTVRVRISSTDDPTVFDISDADFTINTLPNWIQVLVPNGGERWVIGGNRTITWTSAYVPGTVFIEYSKDNFASDLHTIATGETNDGSYLWGNIPSDPSTTVRVRVSSTDSPGVNDKSDNDFSIITTGGWAQTWGGPSDDESYGAAVDASGNYYIVGSFRGTADFDPDAGVVTRTSNGARDVFLSKFNSTGTFQWVCSWGGIGDDYGYGIALDGAGSIYTTGNFWDTVDFDPGSGTSNRSSTGGSDVFLSKISPAGALMWVTSWGGSSPEQGLAVGTAASGNVYVTGSFTGTVDFDPGPGTDSRTSVNSPPPGGPTADVYVSKFDSSGNYSWVRVWGGTGADAGQAVRTDGSENVSVAGWFQSTVDFDPSGGTDNRTSNGGIDVFLSRFSSLGAYQWGRTWGGTANDGAFGLAVESAGSISVVGTFQGTVDMDPGGGVDNRTSNGVSDVFLTRLDSAGLYQWARTWGGTGQETGTGVARDASGYLCVSGSFEGTVDFDPGAGSDSHSSNGSVDAFVSKLDSSGAFQWARTWGATASESCRGVAFDTSSNPYVVGGFSLAVDFAPTGPPCNQSSDLHATNGGSDAYLLKYLSTGCW